MSSVIETVGVVGAGTMGVDIAYVFTSGSGSPR
jgi:3-hydroxyacyl-CoA dehydrogenase